MPQSRRRFEVFGMDDFGDIHCFHTDNRKRAEQIEELMRERLEDVESIEHVENEPQPGYGHRAGSLR